jgi:hypothetical protein
VKFIACLRIKGIEQPFSGEAEGWEFVQEPFEVNILERIVTSAAA